MLAWGKKVSWISKLAARRACKCETDCKNELTKNYFYDLIITTIQHGQFKNEIQTSRT